MDPIAAAPSTVLRYPDRRVALFGQIVLASIAFFASMDVGIAGLLVEPVKLELGLTDVEVGLAHGAAFAVAYGLFSIPMGAQVDRRNRVRLLLVGMIVWSLAMALGGLTRGVTLLVMSRVGLGVVTAILFPGAMSLLADLFPPERRAMATSSFSVGQMVGQAAAILAGGLAFDALTRISATDGGALFGLTPWRVLFVGLAVFGAALIPCIAMMREPVRQEAGGEAAKGRLRDLWAHRVFLAPLLGGMFFLAVIAQAIGVWGSPALMRLYGQTPGAFAGWMSAVTLVGGVAGALAGGRLAELGRRRGGRVGVLVPAILAGLLGIPASFLAMMPNVAGFAVMMGLFTIVMPMGAVAVLIAINFAMPNELRGVTMGLNVLVMALLAGFSPTLVALIGERLGGDTMLGRAIAIVCVPAAAMAALMFALAVRSSAKGSTDPGAMPAGGAVPIPAH